MSFAYVGLVISDDGIGFYQDGKRLGAVKALAVEGGAVKVTDESGSVRVFGPDGPGSPPKLTPAPTPPGAFPGVTKAVADFFGVADEAAARAGTVEDQITEAFGS
jgi:hypothetical protein